MGQTISKGNETNCNKNHRSDLCMTWFHKTEACKSTMLSTGDGIAELLHYILKLNGPVYLFDVITYLDFVKPKTPET